MRNTLKKSFALLLVVCMVLGMMPFAAFAVTTVSVSSLAELQSAASGDGTVIDVTADIPLSAAVTVGGNVKVMSSNGSSVYRTPDYKSYMFVVSDGGELTLENITVNGNKTSHLTKDLATDMIVVQAGAILNLNDGALITTNRVDASVSGGGITVVGTMNMNGGTIANMHGHNTSVVTAQYGAAVTVAGGTVNMYAGIIGAEDIGMNNQNDGRNGAVGVVSGTFNMYGGAISGNVANEQGGGAGGVHIGANGIFNLEGGSVSNNNSRRNGGGFYNEGTLNIKSGTVSGNTATYNGTVDDPTIYFGAAVYNTGVLNISGGEIINNTAKSCGGAVYNLGAMTVTGGKFSGNVSQRYSAGAVFVDGKGTLAVSGGEFSGNTAGQFGGAMAVTSSASNALVITGGSFSSNVCGAGQCGSDIYITTANTSNVATSYIEDCVTYTLYIDNVGSRYSPSNAVPAPSSALVAGNGYVYVASGEGHIYGEWTTVNAATCTAEGLAKRTCVNCGDEETKTIAALGHDWNSGVVTKAATCTSAGTRTYTCNRCSETRTETIKALGHSWNSGTVTTAPTCTKSGVKTYTCTRCSATKTETVAALGHLPGAITTVDPTCTESGSKSYTCQRCNLKISEAIDPLGHNGVVTKIPETCTTAGSITNKCSRCGYILSQATIPAPGHKPGEWTVIVPATKTSTGIKVITCTVCGVELEREIIPVIPDPTVQVKTVEAGIGEKAVKVPVSLIGNEGLYSMGFYIAYSKNLTLNGVLAGDTFTTLVDSKYNVDPATNARAAAAFAAAGVSTDGVYCYRYYSENVGLSNITANGTVCTFVFDLPAESEYEYPIVIIPADGTVINVNGDEITLIYKNGSIIVPDADTCEHVPGEWEVSVAPTCTKAGEQVQKCTVCGKVLDTKPLASPGHSYSEYEVTIEPTCTGAGQKVATCTICGATTTLSIDPLGHVPGEWVVEVQAGPGKEGCKTRRCTRCDMLFDSVIIPPTDASVIAVSSVEAVEGSNATVSVTVENNPGICVTILYLYYDEALSVTDAVVGNVFDSSETTFTKNINPATSLGAPDAFEYAGVPTEGKKATRILCLNNEDADNFNNGTLATFTFAVPEGATGEYTVGLACFVTDDILNYNGDSLDCYFVNGGISVVDYVCDHNWSDWTVTKEVTCISDGEETRTCSVCGAVETKTIKSEGHKYSDFVETKSATCTESGLKVSTCAVCGDEKTEIIPALGHDLGTPVTVEPTCTEAGSVTSTCNRCGEKVVQPIPPKGHTPGDWVIESDTQMAKYCTVCGALVETQVITPDPIIRVTDTTVVTGENATISVNITGNPGFCVTILYLYYDEALSVTDAVVGNVFDSSETTFTKNINPATSLGAPDAFEYAGVPTEGKKATRILCLNNEDADNFSNGTLATFTFALPEGAIGEYTVGLACFMTDDLLNYNAETVPFELINGKITVTDVPPHQHIEGEPEVTPATCTKPGQIVIKCLVGGEVLSTTEIPALGHKPGSWETVKAATASEAGLKEIRCTVCGEVMKSAVIPPVGAASMVISNETVTVGDTASVKVTMENNPGFFGGLWLICYKDDITFDGITIGEKFAAISREAPIDKYVDSVSKFKSLFDELGYSSEGIKAVGLYLEIDDYKTNFTENGLVATLNFSGLDAVGAHDIFFVYHPEDITNNMLENVDFNCIDGSIIVKAEPECDHVAGSRETVKAPTCAEAGTYVVKCAICGTVMETGTIPVIPHTFDDGVITTAATCTEPGVKTYTCTACGFEKTEAIEATGHTFSTEWTIDVPATDTTPGVKSHHCIHCDARTDITEIPVPVSKIYLGDVNGDGKINIMDKVAFQTYLEKGSAYIGVFITENADINNDGRVNAVDMKYVSGYLKQIFSYEDLEFIHG